MCRRLRISDGLTAQADLLTLHHKHLGGVTSYHRWLADKLLLFGDRRPKGHRTLIDTLSIVTLLTTAAVKVQYYQKERC